MSSQVFPTLAGIGWSVKRLSSWKTRVQEAISGKETRLADWSSPRWSYELVFDFLRQANANQQSASFAGQTYNEFAQLAGFFNARQGMFDSFLFTDPDDNTVASQPLGAGDGATLAFQLVRAFGGFAEPVLAPNAVTAVKLAGVAIPAAGLSAPAAPSLSSVASGALAGATYFAKNTYVTNSGETLASAEASLAVAVNHVVSVASPAASTGAIGWNSYLGTSSGAETKQNGSPIAIGTPFQEPNTGLIAGVPLPGANSTGWSLSVWGAPSPGVLTFAGPVAAAIAITADFTYYFPCRFDSDDMTFEKFMAALYKSGIKLKTLKSA
jgi:hypothetical protein